MQCQRGCKTKNKHLEGCTDVQCWGCEIMQTAFSTCTRCVTQFGKALADIQGIWGQLDSMLVAGQSYEIREHISGTPARGLVINEQVMKVKASVRDWAVFVHRIIVSESKKNVEIEDTSTLSLLGFIHSHRGWLLTHELASDFVSDAVAQVKKVSNMISPETRHRIPIKTTTCQAEDERGVCNGRLYAVLRDESSKVESAVYCVTNASHRIAIGDLVNVTKESREWLRNDEAAEALGVTMQNIKVIAHRESWPTKRDDWKECFYSLASVEKYQLRKANK
jgi:hypothetical protein